MKTIAPFDPQKEFVQVHNYIFDVIMPRLKPNSFKVLMFIIRKTKGWGKDADRLSYSQLREGTGIASDQTLHKAIVDLCDLNYISVENDGLLVANNYTLNTAMTFEVEDRTTETVAKRRTTETVAKRTTETVERRTTETVDTERNITKEKEKEMPALSSPSSSQNKQATATEYMPGVPMPSYKLRGNKPDATVKARLPLVEKLIDIWAVRSLTDDADYDGSELGECHKVAAKLLSDGETAQSLDTHYKAYIADGWRNTPVSPSAFARYVAQSKATKSNSNGMVGGQITFKQWCLKTYNQDNYKFIDVPLEELKERHEQSIRVH